MLVWKNLGIFFIPFEKNVRLKYNSLFVIKFHLHKLILKHLKNF